MPASPPRPQHGLDGVDRLVDRLELILEIAADNPRHDGAAGRLARVAVASFEVHRDRQVDRAHDALDHVQMQLNGNVLPVGIAERRSDRVARGGQRAGSIGS